MRACTRAIRWRTPSAAAVPVDDGIQRSHARSNVRGPDRPLPRLQTGQRAGHVARVPRLSQRARRCAPPPTFRDTGALCRQCGGFINHALRRWPHLRRYSADRSACVTAGVTSRAATRPHSAAWAPLTGRQPPTPIAEHSPVAAVATCTTRERSECPAPAPLADPFDYPVGAVEYGDRSVPVA